MTHRTARTLARAWLLTLLVAAFLLSARVGTRATELAATPAPTATASVAALDASPVADPPPTATPSPETTVPAPAAGSPGPPPAPVDRAVGGGGGANQARVVNRRDGQLEVQGNVQLNRIPGPTAGPVNLAYAYSSCVDCTTIAVALQLNLIAQDARRITPQNTAVAFNERCIRCRTLAVAFQYTYQVDDPKETPQEVVELMREMDREVRAIATARGITLQEAAVRLDAVIGRFQTLAASLDDRRSVDERDNPAGTRSPGGGPTTSDTPVPGGIATPTNAPVATPPRPGPEPASTSTVGSDPSPAVAASPTPAVTPTPLAAPTPAPAPPPTATPAPASAPSGAPVGLPGRSASARRHVVGRWGYPVHSTAPTGRPVRTGVRRPSHAGVVTAPSVASPSYLARVPRGDQVGRYATSWAA